MKPYCALKVAKHMFKNKGYYHQNANDLFGLNCFSCGICHSCTRLHHFSSSKINTIVYQIDKCLMVQIWSLKFIKSILNVIYLYMFGSNFMKSIFVFSFFKCVFTTFQDVTHVFSYSTSI